MSYALWLLALTLVGVEGDRDKTDRALTNLSPPSVAKIVPADDKSAYPITLAEAIKTGLENSEVVRVLSVGDPKVIAAVEPDCDPLRLRGEIMAQVRSIEQQYWSLALHHVQLWASQKAVELCEGLLKREQGELEVGRGTVADVAECAQRLEQFRLDLVCKNSDVATTERGLRHLMGLRHDDGRRLFPVTPPTEALVSPDWKQTLSVMAGHQPDVLQGEALVVQAARMATGLDAIENLGVETSPPKPAEAESKRPDADDKLTKQVAALKQVVHETTHSLARFFLEIDSNYKQLQTAKKFRNAATQRLEAQRAFYEQGRITIDRYLDAISQYATSVGQEAYYLTAYNVSIVALEEAKGTLLDYDHIRVADAKVLDAKALNVELSKIPSPVTIAVPLDKDATPASYRRVIAKDGTAAKSVQPTPAAANATEKKAPEVGAGGKKVSFDFTISALGKPVAVKGSFTVSPATP